MLERATQLLVLIAFVVWTVVVVTSYFVVPPNAVDLFDQAFQALPGWREALWRAAGSVLGAAAVLLAARALGATALAVLRVPLRSGAERLLSAWALGFVGLSLVSQALAYTGFYLLPVLWWLVTVAAIAGAAPMVRDIRSVMREIRSAARPVSMSDCLYLAVTCAALAMALVGSLAPESEYDALWYHLWLPQRWLEAGRPVDVVEEYISLYPLSWDLAYGAAIAVGGAGAAKLLHFACLVFVAAATGLLGREFAPRASVPLAVAIVVTTPTVIWEATTAYADLALAWYVAMAIWAFARYHVTNRRAWLVLTAVMLGGALGVKHLGLVAALILGVALVIREMRARRRIATALASGLLVASIALAIASPWYLRAFLASGNPVFPDLYAVFGATPAERWTDDTERALSGFKSRFGRGRTPASLLALPWDVTVHGADYGGAIGPLYLLLVPAVFFARRPDPRQLALLGGSAAYVAVWASPISSYQLRFLLPVLPTLAVAASHGASQLTRVTMSRPFTRVVAATTAVLLVMNLPPFIEWHDRDRYAGGRWLTHVVRGLPMAVVAGGESAEHYLSRRVPAFAAWAFINRELPNDARVLTFSGGDHLYSKRARLWSDSAAATPVTWGAIAGTELATLERLHQRRLTHVLVDEHQLDEGAIGSLAVGSPRFRRCCMAEIYRDRHFSVHTLLKSPRPESTAAVER